ncbi:C40 family peptidase [Gordonia insulae]|uniref:Putative endopeptidase n=1 Tax=Gordonia insulae TaxID=2420509 RepID=A0A3G8JHE1_9ACTN|nr:C40 family peptidase [Gordonia insulae]AZG43670.1 putative endopeptidase [Gordonia insulae]
MAKHRLEQPNRGSKVAKRAVVAGSITVGSFAAVAGPALAAPVHVPNVGTFELPGVDTKQIPQQFQEPKAPAAKATPAAKSPGANVQIPNLGSFTVPGLNDNQIPQQFKPKGGGAIFGAQPTAAQKAVRVAESKIGAPYVYGSAGPNAFDCSGLVYYSYKQAGKTIPRDSYGQLGGGTPVASLAAAKPGDVLIFNGGGHAGLYVGNGTFVHASTSGVPVKRDKVNNWSLTGIRRY